MSEAPQSRAAGLMEGEALRARREERRRVISRRRRVLALTAIVAVVAAVVSTVALHMGANATHRAGNANARRNATSHRPPRSGPSIVRNGPPGSDPVPILMYHVIAAPPAGAPFPGLYVEAAEFAEQMQALKEAGWHAVTLDEVEAYWHQGRPLGAGKPIVVSFDNGYQSQFSQALPVLRRLGWVGEENLQLSGLPPSQGGLGEQEIRSMVSSGWELDTQGISHADLITLDARALREQVAGAREQLRRRFHVPVNWFCYPSGHYDPTVVAAVRSAGYTGSTTVVPGWAQRTEDPYLLPRLRVLRGTTGPGLLALLAGIRGDTPPPASYSG